MTALKQQEDDNRHDNHIYTNIQARDQLVAKLTEERKRSAIDCAQT